jgi:site-specific DNA-cytosine methylase
MKILIACEFSGIVREAFNAIHGNHAISCDILPCEDGRIDYHYQGDVRDILYDGWDLMIAHPPCTHLAVSGARYFYRKQKEQEEALAFVRLLLNAPIDKIALENPIGIISTHIRKPDQIIQPWQFGHETTKATCLWLKGLPKLIPTNIVNKGERQYYASGKNSPIWHAKSGGGSGHERSVTFSGIASAMAEQWGERK